MFQCWGCCLLVGWALFIYERKKDNQKRIIEFGNIKIDLNKLLIVQNDKEFKINNPDASEDEIDYERKRFCRASVVIAVLFKPVSHPKIQLWDMELSAGAVCTTLLIASQSLGYAAQWLTEWYAYNKAMVIELGGNPDTDKIAGFIYIGNKDKAPIERRRPKKENVIGYLEN